MPALECSNCGTAISSESRYCPECGRPLDAAVGLLDQPLVERPVWIAWPPDPVVLIAFAVAIGGLILLVGREWAWGTVALLAAVVLVLARGRLSGRTPSQALWDVRARAAATREAMAARSREQMAIFRARRELAELEADRNRLLRNLGAAVYGGDDGGMTAARAAVDAVVARIQEKEAEIETLRRETEERVERAHAPLRATERMESPPEPARVPEPWPPPDEGDLPGPPTPSPGEPTPGPEEPAPPQHPPMPTGRDG